MSIAKSVVESARKAFETGKTKNISWRLSQLQKLLDMIDDNIDKLREAVNKDLRKSSFEADLMEVMVLKNEIYHTMNNLHNWVKPEYVSKTLAQALDTVYYQYEPLGVTLVLGAWNYPINLLLCPLVGAIAGGNCCIVKPSEVAENTATLLQKLIPKYLDQDCIKVYCGGVDETTTLLEEKFDHIFFTGSTNVGKIVMKAASKHLTSVTLELGGKSPCFVDAGSDLNLCAKRIIWGKLTNCGQTCVAPDYILCHQSILDDFIEELKKVIKMFYGENVQKSSDYGRIINERNFLRLTKIMEAMPKEKIVYGGEFNISEKFIEPTIYKNVSFDDSLMQSELFGPLMPILTVDSADEAISIINKGDKPLALYVFSKSSQMGEKFIENTSSGAVLINDTLMQCGTSNLMFGGIGASGIGAYHGKMSFETFSHKKPIWKRKQNMEALISARYPPFTNKNLNYLNMLTTEKSFCNIL